jgi:hypothetical protein
MRNGCKIVFVPRHLIVEWLPHPEPYGEAIVVFENGMWTDVYTKEDGRVVTPTNDRALIRYLRRHPTKTKD